MFIQVFYIWFFSFNWSLRNLLRILRHSRPRQHRIYSFSVIDSNSLKTVRICEVQRILASLNFWSLSDVLSLKYIQVFKVPSLSQFKITWLPCEYILQISVWPWYLFKRHMPASIRKGNLNTNTEFVWTTSCKSVITNMAIIRCFDITTWSRVLLEKLTGSQLVKKFPTFYETRRFITAFTCPDPEPARSSPCPHIPLPEDPS